MARSTTDNSQLVGIVLIAVGALMLLGWLDIPFLVEIAAIGLIVVGVMIMASKLAGETWMGVVAVVLGIVLLIPLGAQLASIIDTLVGVLVLVAGVLKLLGKW